MLNAGKYINFAADMEQKARAGRRDDTVNSRNAFGRWVQYQQRTITITYISITKQYE